MNSQDKSPAYIQGFIVGLMSLEETRYGYSNPYDRRKQAGKDWAKGQEEGTTYRCTNGIQAADQLRSSL